MMIHKNYPKKVPTSTHEAATPMTTFWQRYRYHYSLRPMPRRPEPIQEPMTALAVFVPISCVTETIHVTHKTVMECRSKQRLIWSAACGSFCGYFCHVGINDLEPSQSKFPGCFPRLFVVHGSLLRCQRGPPQRLHLVGMRVLD